MDRKGWKRCAACGRLYSTAWRADDKLWQAVVGVPGQYCPQCFDEAARAEGISMRWSVERVVVTKKKTAKPKKKGA